MIHPARRLLDLARPLAHLVGEHGFWGGSCDEDPGATRGPAAAARDQPGGEAPTYVEEEELGTNATAAELRGPAATSCSTSTAR